MWSLACVLSEAATWVVLGYTGTRQYSRLRRTAIKKSPRNIKEADPDKLHSKRITGGDCFHDGFSVLPEVLEWHEFLRSMLRPTDGVTHHVLDIIDARLFRPTSQGRCNAEELCKIWASQLKTTNSNIPIELSQDIETTLEEAVGEEVDELSRTFQSLGMQDAEARRAIKSSTSFLQVLGSTRAVFPPSRRLSTQDADQDDPLLRAQMKAMVQRNRSMSSAQHDMAKRFSKQATRRTSSDSQSDKVTVFDSHYHHLAGEVHQNTLSSKVLSKFRGRKTAKDLNKDPRLVKDIVNRDLVSRCERFGIYC